MKTIYLRDVEGNWKEFNYNLITDLSKEFSDRNITIDILCSIGNACMLNNNCTISHHCIIGHSCEIGKGCVINRHCCFDPYCIIGDYCIIEKHVRLGSMVDIKKDFHIKHSIFIAASRDDISYWGDDLIQIGNQCYPIKELELNHYEINKKHMYSPSQINEYKEYLNFIVKMHKMWEKEEITRNN